MEIQHKKRGRPKGSKTYASVPEISPSSSSSPLALNESPLSLCLELDDHCDVGSPPARVPSAILQSPSGSSRSDIYRRYRSFDRDYPLTRSPLDITVRSKRLSEERAPPIRPRSFSEDPPVLASSSLRLFTDRSLATLHDNMQGISTLSSSSRMALIDPQHPGRSDDSAHTLGSSVPNSLQVYHVSSLPSPITTSSGRCDPLPWLSSNTGLPSHFSRDLRPLPLSPSHSSLSPDAQLLRRLDISLS